MDTVSIIALSMGGAWACGINLYAAVVVLGFLGASGSIELPANLEILAHPAVLGAAGLMYCVEFFADKVPVVDSGWDAIHTFIRIPAGALVAAGAVGDVGAPLEFAALLLGGTLAAGSHATKAGTRLAINASPEPVTNWTASIGEDVAVVGGLWAALNYPVIFLCALGAFVALMVWFLPRLWRLISGAIRSRRSSRAPSTN
ncbi:MAG: DUF4126 domain-containing protein [Gammaproteobacteria bacterium]|nr:DUF4126 domain-containing protein [Gammaproteobacteria bacterium]